ncbi:MAG: hypothetical protein K2N44_12710 [Lachnospiraceae bacterium]|nr:hypothetical protein [Lachnospiraceae bacterium]
MKEEKKIEFTQKWIRDAVKKLFQKEDIYESDMEKIKYLRIGEDFYNGYMIEMSTATPADPFCDTDGGDEWELGGDGATVTGRFIQLYIDYMKENPFDYIDSDTGERTFELSQLDFWDEYKEEYEESETEEDREDWKDTVKKWKSYEKTIQCETYIEKFDNDDAYDEWYQRVGQTIQCDIGLFTGLEVLRTQGAEYQDMTFLRTMPLLRVWEVVETQFHSLEGIDDLVRLKQLCCWMD